MKINIKHLLLFFLLGSSFILLGQDNNNFLEKTKIQHKINEGRHNYYSHNIKTALLNYSGKFLACFGSFDQVVPNQYALDMTKWATNSSIFKIRTNHTFGSKHPWTKTNLPDSLKKVCIKTIDFLKSD